MIRCVTTPSGRARPGVEPDLEGRQTYGYSIDFASRELILSGDSFELISGMLVRVLILIKKAALRLGRHLSQSEKLGGGDVADYLTKDTYSMTSKGTLALVSGKSVARRAREDRALDLMDCS